MPNKLNLIVADDHPIFRNGLTSALKGVNFISGITPASDGGDVIKILERRHHDVILMDIKMTPINGIEATSIISNRFPTAKVIALTMNEDEESITQMLRNGAAGYLIKSTDRDEIIMAIKNVSEGKRYFSNEISFLLAKKIAEPQRQLKNNENGQLKGERIRDVLYLMCFELSNTEIADLMCLSIRTVEYHRKRITIMTDSRNYIGVMKYAIKSGIMDDEQMQIKWDIRLGKIRGKIKLN